MLKDRIIISIIRLFLAKQNIIQWLTKLIDYYMQAILIH
jgi:hypothetical protein